MGPKRLDKNTDSECQLQCLTFSPAVSLVLLPGFKIFNGIKSALFVISSVEPASKNLPLAALADESRNASWSATTTTY